MTQRLLRLLAGTLLAWLQHSSSHNQVGGFLSIG
jgi:hypothetical protein